METPVCIDLFAPMSDHKERSQVNCSTSKIPIVAKVVSTNQLVKIGLLHCAFLSVPLRGRC